MKREDAIALCRYYKGESETPFEKLSNESFFWDCEKQYVENVVHSDAFRKEWEDDAEYYMHTHPNEKNALTSKDISIETKGIILYIESMLMKWRPYEVNIIFDY